MGCTRPATLRAAMCTVKTSALARAGLLGNPSDLYGGRGIGFTIQGWQVDLELAEATEVDLGSDLLLAGWKVFCAHTGRGPEAGFTATFTTTIPRQVGLAGSSAILIALLRALAIAFATPLDPLTMARLALSAEVDLLGIRAGPMDRLVQAHEGLLALDFLVPFAQGSVQRLDAGLAPPMLIAWDTEPKKTSGAVHTPVWDRFQAGDPVVHAVLAEYRPLVERGLAALLRGDREELMACVNRNFDLRASIFAIGERDRAMIQLGRAAGAATKFCGSGGAILAVTATREAISSLVSEYHGAGFAAREVVIGSSLPCT